MAKITAWMILPAMLLAVASRSVAAAEPKAAKDTYSESPLIWSADAIMDRFVDHMTRYYNLDETQQKYTKGLMTQKVKRFLTDYEQDVRWLAYDMWDYQQKGEVPPPEIAREWGRRGGPLIKAIRKEIIDGNMEWREILTDEQKRKHDRDLRIMNEQFDEMESKADRWSRGEIRPSDLRNTRGLVNNDVYVVRKSEDAWTSYVRSFAQLYELDEGQRNTAYSLLRQLKERARQYRESNKAEFDQIEKQKNELTAGARKNDPQERKQASEAFARLREKREKLEKPISDDMFAELKRKLEQIPTDNQRKARQAVRDKLDAIAASRPAAESASRPAVAETRPAGSGDREGGTGKVVARDSDSASR